MVFLYGLLIIKKIFGSKGFFFNFLSIIKLLNYSSNKEILKLKPRGFTSFFSKYNKITSLPFQSKILNHACLGLLIFSLFFCYY